MIFENKERNYLGFKDYLESDFQFYDRTANPEFAKVRDIINYWTSEFPIETVDEINRRIKTEFPQVFYELFIYTIFNKLGFDLSIHPPLKDANTKPDFYALKEDFRLYIESTVTSEYKKSVQIDNSIYQTLIQIRNSNFMLLVDTLNLIDGKQPPLKKIKSFYTEELNKLNPDSLGSDLEKYPKLTYADNSVEIEIIPCPRKPEYRNSTQYATIGSYPVVTRWGGSTNTFKKAIFRKSGRYNDLKTPLIIALNFLSPWGTYENEIIDALYGSRKTTINIKTNDTYNFRMSNGVFFGPNGPQCKRISGVIITSINPFNIEKTDIRLFHNPHAKYPIPIDKLDFPQDYIDHGTLKYKEGLSIAEILIK
jgi:hypothetical protein